MGKFSVAALGIVRNQQEQGKIVGSALRRCREERALVKLCASDYKISKLHFLNLSLFKILD